MRQAAKALTEAKIAPEKAAEAAAIAAAANITGRASFQSIKETTM